MKIKRFSYVATSIVKARLLLAVIFLFWGLFPLSLSTVEAAPSNQAGSLFVVSSSAKARFGVGLSFGLQARTTRGQITQAELRLTLGKNPTEYIVGPGLVPGADAEAKAEVSYDKIPLAAGMPVNYYWIFSNNSGERARTEVKTVVYEDTRFNWRQRSGPVVTVRWYQGDEDYGSLMYVLANDALNTYRRRFSITTTEQIYISIYASSQEYLDAAPDVPSWSGGYTLAERNEILAVAPQNRIASILIGEGIPHELSHAALYQHLGKKSAPAWLDEGFAVYNQNVIAPRYDQILQAAYKQNSLIPLSSLNSTFPRDSNTAELAYAQGRSMVTFLINNYNDAVWANVLDQLRYGNIDRAMQKVFGVNLAAMEEQWKNSLGGKKVTLPPALLSGPVPELPPTSTNNVQEASFISKDLSMWFIVSGLGGALIMALFIIGRAFYRARKPAGLPARIQSPVFPGQPQSYNYYYPPPSEQRNNPSDTSSDIIAALLAETADIAPQSGLEPK